MLALSTENEKKAYISAPEQKSWNLEYGYISASEPKLNIKANFFSETLKAEGDKVHSLFIIFAQGLRLPFYHFLLTMSKSYPKI